MFNNVNPKVIASASKEQLSANGIANDKISLIKAITYDIVDKKLKLDKLVKEDTEAIKKILLKYKGLSE
jgi:3-methyladenine DNA glycosylase/8-oxoguanine DNA glycosylase